MLKVKQGLALLVQPAMKSTLVRAAMLIPLAPSLRSPQIGIAAHTKVLALEPSRAKLSKQPPPLSQFIYTRS